MLRVIVSKTLDDKFKNFTVVREFKHVKSLDMDKISVLIIYDFPGTDFDAGVFISDFYKAGIKTFVYISKDPNVTVKMAINGVSGFVFDDDFYFDDEEELEDLIDSLGIEEDESLADTSAAIVGDFIQSFARGDEKIKAPLYLEQVTEAVNELSKSVNQKDYQIAVMGESAIDIFSRASDIIRTMSANKTKLETQLKDLQRIQSSANNIKPTFNNNVQFFPQVQYMRTPKLLLIREYTPCRYLTSFLLMYNQYVHYRLNKRTKFVILYKNCFCESRRYRDEFAKISNETYKMDSLYDKELIAINAPKKEVMNKLFDKQIDLFIVLDRMYENEDMISGRIKKLNAVSGIGDTAVFNIKPEQTIMSITDEENSFCVLKSLANYPKDFDAQVTVYFQSYQNFFKKMDKFIGF